MRPHRQQPTRLRHPCDSPGKNTGVGCHFLLQCMKVKSESEVTQSCPTSSDPMDCNPPGSPGSSVHRIFQARVPEWVAIAFSGALAWGALFPWACISSVHSTYSHNGIHQVPEADVPVAGAQNTSSGVKLSGLEAEEQNTRSRRALRTNRQCVPRTEWVSCKGAEGRTDMPGADGWSAGESPHGRGHWRPSYVCAEGGVG